jgi:hypothetical protein
LLFSHRNDVQLVLTGIAKAVGKDEVQKSLGHALLELMSETLAQIGERHGKETVSGVAAALQIPCFPWTWCKDARFEPLRQTIVLSRMVRLAAPAALSPSAGYDYRMPNPYGITLDQASIRWAAM